MNISESNITKRILDIYPPPGKSPRAFGPALWICLHVAAMSTTLDSKNYVILHKLMTHVLPCSNCRKNHERFRMESRSITFTSPQDWVNQAHNFVNKLNGNSEWSLNRCNLVTEQLYSLPDVLLNAFFKVTAILIGHYSEGLPTQAFLRALIYLLPFTNRHEKLMLSIIQRKWSIDSASKMNLLRALESIRKELEAKHNLSNVYGFNQWCLWINQSAYGDIPDLPTV